MAVLETWAGRGRPDLPGREGTLAAPGPGDSRERGEHRGKMGLRAGTDRTGYREYLVSLVSREREETEGSLVPGELWVSLGLLV